MVASGNRATIHIPPSQNPSAFNGSGYKAIFWIRSKMAGGKKIA
jgi:hypothetical protein